MCFLSPTPTHQVCSNYRAMMKLPWVSQNSRVLTQKTATFLFTFFLLLLLLFYFRYWLEPKFDFLFFSTFVFLFFPLKLQIFLPFVSIFTTCLVSMPNWNEMAFFLPVINLFSWQMPRFASCLPVGFSSKLNMSTSFFWSLLSNNFVD